MKWLEDQPRLQASLRRTLESVSPRGRRHSAWFLLHRAAIITLEFLPPYANSASIGFTTRVVSAGLKEGIPLQVRIYPTYIPPLSLIGRALILLYPASRIPLVLARLACHV